MASWHYYLPNFKRIKSKEMAVISVNIQEEAITTLDLFCHRFVNEAVMCNHCFLASLCNLKFMGFNFYYYYFFTYLVLTWSMLPGKGCWSYFVTKLA